jgi:hypothetical protein
MRRDIYVLCIGVFAVSAYILLQKQKQPSKRSTEFVIDPSIYTRPSRTFDLELPRQPIAEEAIQRAPYEMSGFGHDVARNTDDISIDTYMNLPLVGTGQTFVNRDIYEELDEEKLTYTKMDRYKYIRLRILDMEEVYIGGIDFMKYGRSIGSSILWNPHTGEKTPYMMGELHDNDQNVFIFCFKEPVLFNSYRIKSSTNMRDAKYDPIDWVLEGSLNGNFWKHIDTRTNVEFPLLRGVWLSYNILLH